MIDNNLCKPRVFVLMVDMGTTLTFDNNICKSRVFVQTADKGSKLTFDNDLFKTGVSALTGDKGKYDYLTTTITTSSDLGYPS